jgi:hypothetical protein
MNKALLKKLGILLVVVMVGLAVAVFAIEQFHIGGVDLPLAETVDAKNRDDILEKQGWTSGWGVNPLTQAQWFHHASQGTKILKYAWFMALEQPDPLTYFVARPRIVEGDYLLRFGFLPSEKDPNPDPKRNMNPDGLPIGFAKQDDFLDPTDPKKGTFAVVGLTCAGCHTGEIHYKDENQVTRAVRIEGGPAMTNLAHFQKAIALSLFYTQAFDAPFNRFADRVLGARTGDAIERNKLRAELRAVIKKGQDDLAIAQRKGLNKLDLGFARTDALGLIGNRVFGPLDNENLTVSNAPVNFPHLWDTAWLDWVQYNASIRMPMVRNIGEALGVGAVVNMSPDVPKGERYPSSVNVEGLHLIEDQLGGPKPFQGLRSPRWSDTKLPAIDERKSIRGKGLYRNYCQSCHLPPIDELEKDLASKTPSYWVADGDIRVLKVNTSDLQLIGTDPNQALNFYRRLAYVGGDTVSAAKGLYNVTGFIRNKFYKSQNFDAAKVKEFDRFRPFKDETIEKGDFDLENEGVISATIVARLAYKARPLNGIWATAPFFHNGSVPNLYEVLLPAKDRSETFYLGTKLFDPVKVGFVTAKISGGFNLDTTLSGNLNIGHEFRNLSLDELELVQGITPPSPLKTTEDDRWANALGLALPDWKALSADQRRKQAWETTRALIRKRGFVVKGVIGPELTDTERWDLVEYLKSL